MTVTAVHASSPETAELPTADHTARAVLGRLERAWNQADGLAFGEVYADDATFVTIRGERLLGRAQIAAGHAQIFATIYAGSTNRMELVDTRLIAEDVILASSTGTLTAPHGPLQGVHTAISTHLLVRSNGQWRIRNTHNTLRPTA